MRELIRILGISFGLALTFLSIIGFYLIAIDLVYFADIVFVYSWIILLLLFCIIGIYLIWYYYNFILETVE